MVAPRRWITSAVVLTRCLAVDHPEVVLRGVYVGALRADLVAHRIVLEVGNELGDRAVERGREQQDLAVLRRLLDDATNGGQEAHVGHLVGFVDDDGGDVTQVDRSHLHQVFEPAGACHDEFDTAVERLALSAVADTAVHRRGIVAGSLREGVSSAMICSASSRVGARTRATGRFGRASIRRATSGQTEAEGLAGAGGGAAGNVAAGEGVGDDGGLDGEGVVFALALEAVHDRIGQAEVTKGDGLVVGGVGGHDAVARRR